MSEENISAKAESQRIDQVAAEKVDKYRGIVDGWINKGMGVVGDHPWEDWVGIANRYVDMFLPAIVALAGVLAFLTVLVNAIRMDAPVSMVFNSIWILVGTVFATHLAPKTLPLVRSFIEKSEIQSIRPELGYVLKVILGLGGFVTALSAFFTFDSEGVKMGITLLIIAAVACVVFTRPAVIGMKYDYPTNCVEECISLIMLPVRILLCLFTPIIGLSVIGGLIYGIVLWFDNGIMASIAFASTALAPVVVSLAVYFFYIALVFMLDLYRAVCSIPRKLDELAKASQNK